jgi:hypothetical protein
MIIKRINPPMFTINDEQYNEYELRQLMLDVAKGEIDAFINVTDSDGLTATIDSLGRLSNELKGLVLADNLSLELFLTNIGKG